MNKITWRLTKTTNTKYCVIKYYTAEHNGKTLGLRRRTSKVTNIIQAEVFSINGERVTEQEFYKTI